MLPVFNFLFELIQHWVML